MRKASTSAGITVKVFEVGVRKCYLYWMYGCVWEWMSLDQYSGSVVSISSLAMMVCHFDCHPFPLRDFMHIFCV